MSAGRLNHRIRFESRSHQTDDYGNEESSEFTSRFVRWAEIKPSLGLETVTAARLQGRQPVDIVVYLDSETREIEAGWRATDEHEGTVYAIRSPPIDMQQNRRYLTMKAESGVAA